MMPIALAAFGKAAFAFVMMAIIAALCAGMIRLIVVVLTRLQRVPDLPEPMVVSVIPSRDETAEIAAVIGAAVHFALSYRPHRIIHIGEAPSSTATGWTRQMRSRHHGSHLPRR